MHQREPFVKSFERSSPVNPLRNKLTSSNCWLRNAIPSIVLLLLLFTLSGCTFLPNTTHTSNVATGIAIPRAVQMSEMLPHSTTDGSCSDVVIPEGFSLSGFRLYVNGCALQHLNAWVTTAGPGAIVLIMLLGCQECAPLITWIGAITSGISGGIDFLQIDTQGCSGAYVDISLNDGIKVTPVCDSQTRTP
jgi:hypothetical protein